MPVNLCVRVCVCVCVCGVSVGGIKEQQKADQSGLCIFFFLYFFLIRVMRGSCCWFLYIYLFSSWFLIF